MTKDDMIARTNQFSLDIVAFCTPLRRRDDVRQMANQLFDAGTSTAANYRAATRGRSRDEFIAKLCIAAEEIDESLHWLQQLRDSGLAKGPDLDRLLKEATELRNILAASRATAIRNNILRKQEAERKKREEQQRNRNKSSR